MANINVPTSAKRNGTTNRARLDRAVNDRLRIRAREATKDFEEIGGIAKDAKEKLEQLSENASGYYEQGQEKARQVRRTLEQFIREEPVKTVLIAAGVGLVFGRFWMRR
jgi:ElaB/YqjD/DUF883 family membrane-anchored ribosome-binding protein